MEQMEQFIDELISAAGLDILPKELISHQKDQLKVQLTERIGVELIGSLDENGAQEYVTLFASVENPDETALRKFLEEKLPDYQKVVQSAVENFSAQYLAAFNKNEK